MKYYRLSIITENQKQPEKADKIANLIKMDLGIKADPEISKYQKLVDSYKIEFLGQFESDSNLISEAIELTDRIASPWMVQYFRTTGEIALIFNKSDSCRYKRKEFNCIHWANLEVE